MQTLHDAQTHVAALRAALGDCWTLCNTQASLSDSHRQRILTLPGTGDAPEQAWRSCWRLWQQLYTSCDAPSQTLQSTLELCRDFCHTLFEARHRGDEASDSILRVSFELNNHLYNTHDRVLPQAFRERTLDFYITLCHRLMKQDNSLSQETDALLRACWSLAEMLFSLHQTSYEAKCQDEELLGSAVQACWELCDLFRESWTRIRPERGTPRPSQMTFPANSHRAVLHSDGRSSSMSNNFYHDALSAPPETPSTIFDNTTAAPSPDSVSGPNILVLGIGARSGGGSNRDNARLERWSSNASSPSDYSESSSSQRTSSTATAGSEATHLMRLRGLILHAATNVGFSRVSAQTLAAFVRELPQDAFGALQWQMRVFDCYRRLVLADSSLEHPRA